MTRPGRTGQPAGLPCKAESARWAALGLAAVIGWRGAAVEHPLYLSLVVWEKGGGWEGIGERDRRGLQKKGMGLLGGERRREERRAGQQNRGDWGLVLVLVLVLCWRAAIGVLHKRLCTCIFRMQNVCKI